MKYLCLLKKIATYTLWCKAGLGDLRYEKKRKKKRKPSMEFGDLELFTKRSPKPPMCHHLRVATPSIQERY
jgi:hypothetical protein